MESFEGYKDYTTKVDRNFCLNGIAYYKDTNTLLLTGKKWPLIFEIQFQEQN